MKLYAENTTYRLRQIVQDVLVLLWIALWVRIGLFMHDLVQNLAAPGRIVEDAGVRFTDAVESLETGVEDVPLVGDSLGAPFETIADAGERLQEAGRNQQEVVGDFAFWLALLLAVIAIGYVLFKYVPDRLRWIREAGAAHKIRIDAVDLRVFALRALVSQPLYELRRVAPDPADAYEAGDYEGLASLELARLGLKAYRRQ
jgi:hypothetical protein